MLSKKWTTAGEEPKLKDLMNDPLVALIMKRDNLVPDDVWKVVEQIKNSLGTRTEMCAA